jgi:hypothetical protein
MMGQDLPVHAGGGVTALIAPDTGRVRPHQLKEPAGRPLTRAGACRTEV